MSCALWLQADQQGATPPMWGDPMDCKAHKGRCDKRWPIGEKDDGSGYYYSLDGCPAKAIWPSTWAIVNSRLMDLALRYRNTNPAVLFGGKVRDWPLTWCALVSECRDEIRLIAQVKASREASQQSQRTMKSRQVQ